MNRVSSQHIPHSNPVSNNVQHCILPLNDVYLMLLQDLACCKEFDVLLGKNYKVQNYREND